MKSTDKNVCICMCGSVNVLPQWNLINTRITQTELSSCWNAAGRKIYRTQTKKKRFKDQMRLSDISVLST